MFRFFAILFLIWLSLQIIWMLFGKYIIRFLLCRLTKKMEQNFWAQQNQHQPRYDPNFEKEVQLDDQTRLKVPKKEANEKPAKNYQSTQGVQDVDFTEIDEKP